MVKRKFAIFLGVSFLIYSLILISPSLCYAAPAPEDVPIVSGNGLSWAVDNGTILDYSLTVELNLGNLSSSFQEFVFYTISYVGPIPDNFRYIPSPAFEVYWATNGSRLFLGDHFQVGDLTHSVYNPAIPIGNWTLLNVYIQSSFLDVYFANATLTLIDSDTAWGFRYDYLYYGYLVESETIWYKSDGSLQSVHLTVDIEEETIYEVILARVTGLDPIYIISLAGIGIFGVATVVILYQIIRDRKSGSGSGD